MPFKKYRFGYKRSKDSKERNVLSYLGSWKTIKEVARRMSWSRQTASSYLRKLYNKGKLKKKFISGKTNRRRMYKRK